jgi:hypothetical protein
MNDDIREKHARQVAINNAAVSQTMAEIYQAQANGDQETEDSAITTLAALRTQRREIDAMAAEAMNPQNYAQPARDQYGLTQEERDIAERSFCGANFGMSKEHMHREYARQKAKLHHMRATGQYRYTTDQTG